MNKPNILMLMGDQHPVFMNGCYGHPLARTPSLDQLAEKGVVFDSAYCPSPLCAPSRAAMLTSRHVHDIEVWDNASPLRSDWPTFVHSLRAGGYQTYLSGKMHFVGADQLHGFEERWTQEIYPTTFDWTYLSRDGVYINPPNKGQARHRVLESGIGWTPDMDYDEEVLFRTQNGLRHLSRSNDKRPFFLCTSFTGPHYPYYAPKEYWDLYNDKDIELPYLPEDYRERDHAYGTWFRQNTHLEEPVSDEVCIRARHAMLGRISMIDDYIGHILTTLRECGLEENTIVLYVSDHGDMMGEHGLWFKCCAYEWSMRVPFILYKPGMGPCRIDEPVSLFDLGPTLCALAGVRPVYERSEGRDLTDLIEGSRASGDGLVISEYFGVGTWRGWRMTRSGKYKLVYVPEHPPQLYDLENDPDEWNDLAGIVEYKSILSELVEKTVYNWDPDECDELRWQQEERRVAVLKAQKQGRPVGWNMQPTPVPHPFAKPENLEAN
jgi:choline-sulfatase